MGEKPQTEVAIRDFAGMVSNTDPRDLQPGQSQVQINATTRRKGELVIRRGYREIAFDVED